MCSEQRRGGNERVERGRRRDLKIMSFSWGVFVSFESVI